MKNIRNTYSHNIYYYLLVLTAISLPLSEFALSVSIILLFLNWIIEGRFYEKWQVLKNRKSVILILTVYLIHIVSLVYTNDLKYGLFDIRIKLPLFIFPLVIGTSKSINFSQLKNLILLFILALFVGSMCSLAALFGLINIDIVDIRDISILIRHIMFAILINIGIFLGAYLLFYKNDGLKKYEKGIILFNIIWLSVFLIILKSFTGIILYVLLLIINLFIFIKTIHNKKIRYLFISFIGLIPVIIFIYLFSVYNDYYSTSKIDYNKLDTFTKKGNVYYHYKHYGLENGNFVWIYVCEEELKEEWDRISNFEYNGVDKKGQRIRTTLIRYMASKGLRKDAEGISMLTENDIENIETGMTNYKFDRKLSFYQRIYELIWELDNYKRGANPSGHSIIQRLEYFKTGLLIFKSHPLFGTGNGDVKESFKKKYEEINSVLTHNWRLRAHNQYITFLLTFGIIGFLWIVFATLYPIWYEKKCNNYFFLLVFFVFAVSMINEDTLETHVGVSMVAFFYSLFLFGYNKGNKNDFH